MLRNNADAHISSLGDLWFANSILVSTQKIQYVMKDLFVNINQLQLSLSANERKRILWREILAKDVIGSYQKVHYIEFACILSYRTRYAVMSYSVMLYCNRNNVLSYLVTLYRNQNSIVSYSSADVSYPVAIHRCFERSNLIS